MKKELPASIFTQKAGQIMKKADPFICQVDGQKVYVTDTHVLFAMSPVEYDYYIRPVIGYDPGNFEIRNKEKRPSTVDLKKLLTNQKAEMHPAQVAPFLYPAGPSLVKALKAADFISFINVLYLDALKPETLLKSSGQHAPTIAYDINGDPAAMLLPVRVNNENIKRSAAAYFEEVKPDENAQKQAAKIARLEDELKARYRQIDDLEAANQAKEKELAAMRNQPKAEKKPEKKSPDDIAASFTKYGKITIKGAQTASPIIWIVADKDKAEALKNAGARWSAKKSAWYVQA